MPTSRNPRFMDLTVILFLSVSVEIHEIFAHAGCAQNFYGENCYKCLPCAAHARCDDGKLGSGKCMTSKHYRKPAFAGIYHRNFESTSGLYPIEFSDDPGDLVVTTVFSNLPDAQRQNASKCRSCYEYVRPWLESVRRQGLSALVLHDNLDARLILELQTPRIRFRTVPTSGLMELADERWIFYLSVLLNRPISIHDAPYHVLQPMTAPVKFRYVLFTDCHDVYFVNNPFKLMFGNYKLFIGNEGSSWNSWMYSASSRCGIGAFDTNVTWNAGIVGGDHAEVLRLVRKMVILLLFQHSRYNRYQSRLCDMPALNMIISSMYKRGDVFTGWPLHSRFKYYEKTSTVFIRHK